MYKLIKIGNRYINPKYITSLISRENKDNHEISLILDGYHMTNFGHVIKMEFMSHIEAEKWIKNKFEVF